MKNLFAHSAFNPIISCYHYYNNLLWRSEWGGPPEADEHDDVHDSDEECRDGEGCYEETDMEGFKAVVLFVKTAVGIW